VFPGYSVSIVDQVDIIAIIKVGTIRINRTRTQEGSELYLSTILIVLEHSCKLFGLSVWSEVETKLIAEIIKETQYFYVENHLWPN